MEVSNPKGGRTATPAFLAMLLMIVSMMLLNAYCCSAAVLAKKNTSFQCGSGRLDECRLIEEDLELELEFLMNPYVSRILSDKGQSLAGRATESGPVVKPCGREPSEAACIAKSDPNLKKCGKRNAYKRCNLEPQGS